MPLAKTAPPTPPPPYSAARAPCVWLWGRSPSRGAHGAAACGAALALLAPASSCRRARGGVALGRRSSVAAARSLGARGASCSAARAPCVWLWGRSPSRGAHGAAACGAALALLAPARSCRRARGGVALGRRSSVAAARSLGARGASCSAARAPCVWLWGRSPSRGAHGAAACGAALALLAPACSCRRARGGVTLGRRSSVAAARSLGARGASCSAARALCVWLWGRSPSRGAHGAAACGAALALLAPASSCRRARGGVTLGRRSSAAAARSLGARSARRLALLRLVAGARCLCWVVAVARRSRRRCLRRRAGAPGAGFDRAAALAAA